MLGQNADDSTKRRRVESEAENTSTPNILSKLRFSTEYKKPRKPRAKKPTPLEQVSKRKLQQLKITDSAHLSAPIARDADTIAREHERERETKQQKVETVTTKIENQIDTTKRGGLSICYRTDGDGKGAHYDHHTTQLILNAGNQEPDTHVKTSILWGNEKSPEKLKEYIQSEVTHKVSIVGLNDDDDKDEPDSLLYGAVLIPGVHRKIYNNQSQYTQRKIQNKAVISEAINKGKPMLAVCGGSWEVWDYFGGTLRKVKGHASERMMSLKQSGKVGNNHQIHRISFTEEASILKAAMTPEGGFAQPPPQPDEPIVNSVHWMAPDETNIPENFPLNISAWSVKDDAIAHGNHKTNARMEVEENTIEAFESKYGAPILGVLFHPESYTRNANPAWSPERHRAIFHYFSKASIAYEHKQKMLSELVNEHPKLKKTSLLTSKISFFKRTRDLHEGSLQQEISPQQIALEATLVRIQQQIQISLANLQQMIIARQYDMFGTELLLSTANIFEFSKKLSTEKSSVKELQKTLQSIRKICRKKKIILDDVIPGGKTLELDYDTAAVVDAIKQLLTNLDTCTDLHRKKGKPLPLSHVNEHKQLLKTGNAYLKTV